MEDDILKDEDELEIKVPLDVEKTGDLLDEDTESVEGLAEEEEEEEEEPFDDINPI